MKQLLGAAITMLVLLASCQEFTYDPTVPYPLLNPGDFWPSKFDQRGLQNAIIYRDKLYCNTIDVAGDGNYLYCLDPKTGLVVWRAHVEAYASQSASFLGDTVLYCSYLGHISAITKTGEVAWKARFDYPYGGHWVDTAHARLLVTTVYWNQVYDYDIKFGKLTSKIENDSLKQLIQANRKDDSLKEEHAYQFVRDGKTYIINCRPSKQHEVGDYTIEIKN